MKTSFFKKELMATQSLFSQAYKGLVVYDIKTRIRVIFGIAHLGCLQAQIDKNKNKDFVRREIKEFMKKKKIVSAFLMRMIKHAKHRNRTDNHKLHTKGGLYGIHTGTFKKEFRHITENSVGNRYSDDKGPGKSSLSR